VNLLDGSFANQTFQVGANGSSNDQISITAIASAKSSSLGVGAASSYKATAAGTTTAGTAQTALAAGELSINGYQVGASSGDGVSFSNADGSGIAKAAAINAISGQTGVTATVGATTVAGAASTTGLAIASGDIKINGVNLGALSASNAGAERGAQVAAAVNAISSQTGIQQHLTHLLVLLPWQLRMVVISQSQQVLMQRQPQAIQVSPQRCDQPQKHQHSHCHPQAQLVLLWQMAQEQVWQRQA
jgi:hypothetical protein